MNTDNRISLRSLSSYLSLVSTVGLAYILNFSLMRVSEGAKLRANCHEIEVDPLGNHIHLIKGITTKTIEDDDARWIVAPTVEKAISAMTVVAKLRVNAGKENPAFRMSKDDIVNPILQAFPHEPWSPRSNNSTKEYKTIRSYADVWNIWPKLFDESQMVINATDIKLANELTFGLDPDKYAAGKVWPLSWHQLRRTGAVNMLR